MQKVIIGYENFIFCKKICIKISDTTSWQKHLRFSRGGTHFFSDSYGKS